MNGLPLFALTSMEMAAFLILWSTLSIKLSSKTILKLAAIAIIISLITVITDNLKVEYSGILNYLIAFIIMQLLFKKPFKQSISYYMISIAICLCVQIVIVFILRSTEIITQDLHAFSNAFKINLMFIFVNILIASILPADRIQKHLEKDFNIVSFIVINAALYAVILKTSWDFIKSLLWDKFIYLVYISVLLILINLIFLKYSIKIREQKKIIESYNRYSPIIINLIEEARRKQHEFKNHLNTIYGIAQVASDSELRSNITQYIRSLNYELKDLDILIQINNKVLSGIIYSKLCYAREQGIDFEYHIESDLSNSSLEDYELSEVLNNLLDNAFEAVCTSENKKVILTIEENNKHHVIEVKNYGELIKPENISRLFDRGFTTKGSRDHGYGLYNVKRIVDSVNGQIQLLYDDDEYIVFKILF